jgi:ABC-type multidrug transport system ATPase subunit
MAMELGADVSKPKLLLLDEPSLGLAPAIVDAMYDAFANLHKDGQTILLAEQSVELAPEAAAGHAYVLQVGRTVLQGTASELAHNPDVQRIYLGVEWSLRLSTSEASAALSQCVVASCQTAFRPRCSEINAASGRACRAASHPRG